MRRLTRLAMWAVVIVFVGYVLTTRPAVASDAAHATMRGMGAAANAAVTFLDDLIPRDQPRARR